MASSSGTAIDNTAAALGMREVTRTPISNGAADPVLHPTQASPWGKSPSSQVWSNSSTPSGTVSFANVMSEQLADTLQEQEMKINNLKLEEEVIAPDDLIASQVWDPDFPDTSNDEALALMLQAELDKEYNEYLSKEETRVNQNSKVKVSYDKYRTCENFASDSSPEEEDLDDDVVEDEQKVSEDPTSDLLQISKTKGYKVFGKKIVTKHDTEICGRRNVARMEDSFPAEFFSGDARGMDLQLPNHIFNSLKRHAYSEQRRSQRLHETKECYTAEHAVDEKTRLLMHRLVNRGILASVNGVISVGKESVVIHADGGDAVPQEEEHNSGIDLPEGIVIPSECAIKVYKTTLNEFRRREKYIKDDFRFKDRFKKLNPRKIIHMWAEKEMHNLYRIQEAGIPCPDVVLLKKHILVMSFIGTDQRPAPKLKDAVLSRSQKLSAYAQVIHIMKTLFHQCRLIHSDLSEYNLLWKNDKVWVIDVSQAVEPNHPHGLEFLYRDCENISRFFRNLQLEAVSEPMQLFNEVSGLDLCTTDKTLFLFELERLQRIADEHSHQGLNKMTALLDQDT